MRDGWSSSARTTFHPISSKRNIGSLARQGLLRSDFSSYLNQRQYRQQADKRYIGSLARSGLLPSFRSARGNRVNRSGRTRSRIVGFLFFYFHFTFCSYVNVAHIRHHI